MIPSWLILWLIGVALVASGAQSPTPAVPAVLGGLILLNAALTKGAIGAFRAYSRRIHRLLDPVVILVCVGGAVQPWFGIEASTRAVVLASAFARRASAAARSSTSDSPTSGQTQ